MTMYETETLIVGGGLMGCWTALFLAQMDREVTVLEKGYIGAQASGVNYGNLRIQGRHPGQLPLSLRAQEIWERFEEITGEDCEIAQCGHLYVAHCDEQAAKLEIYATEARAHGLDVEQLKREDVFARWPWFGSNVIAANFSGRDGCANPRLSTPAVARAAVRAGAQIVEQTHCIATRKEGSGFRITTDTDDTYQGHNLVNAAGAWANIIAEAFGERAPMFAAGPPQFVTEPLPPFIAPSVQSVDGQVIFRQVARGNVVVAGYPRGPSDIVLNRAPVPPCKTLATMRRLSEVVPALSGVSVIRVWSGIEGYVHDMLPVISPSKSTENLFHAFGFCGHGFQISPGVGKVLAELIIDGHSDTPIADFSIERFDKAGWSRSHDHAAEFEMSLTTDVDGNGL